MASYDPTYIVKTGASYDASKLSGKSVIITGGASGLGEAMAHSFVKAGAFVTIGDLSEERGKKVVSDLGGEEKACFVKCDVLSWKDQLNMFKTAIAKSPSKGVDVVAANAGISGVDDVFLDKVDESSSDGDPLEPNLNIFKINTIGVMYTTKLALHYLPRQPEGEGRDRCLILTASLAGYIDLPGSPQYEASKWAVRGLMRSLRHVMPGRGCRVNVLAPWYIKTPIMSQEVVDKLASKGMEFAEKDDAAGAVMHMASDKSLNGRALAVVTRDIDSRGYVDLQLDDYAEGELLHGLQKTVLGSGHRIGTK